MPCFVTILTRSAIKKTTRKKNKQQNKQKLQGKAHYLKLKAPSNNVKTQSDKTLITQTYFFLTIKQIEMFLNETT